MHRRIYQLFRTPAALRLTGFSQRSHPAIRLFRPFSNSSSLQGHLQRAIPPSLARVLYSVTMNRMLIIAVVACVILFVAAVLIAPTLDLQPSALRAQQWLSFIAAMFSIAGLFKICFQVLMVPTMIGPPRPVSDPRQQVPSLDLSGCLLC